MLAKKKEPNMTQI